MKELIVKMCKEIEKEQNIKILFAVESGSRAWRIDSKDSDYDIRFLYVRPLNEYLRINRRDEVITAACDKEGNKHSQEGCYFDLVGFDIYKFARMLHSSNPQVIEWLTSDILYYGVKPKVFVDYAKNHFKPISLYFHYKSMCRQNYLKYLKSKNQVTYKKYLYSMRGLINAKWIITFYIVPPISFLETLSILEHKSSMKLEEIIPTGIIFKLYKLIELKKKGKEKDIIKNIVHIDNYIEEFLKNDDEAPKNKKLDTSRDLDLTVREIVTEDLINKFMKLAKIEYEAAEAVRRGG